MNDDRYLRSIKDLEKVGSKWWPKEVKSYEIDEDFFNSLLEA